MNADFINPFVTTAFNVFDAILLCTPEKGTPRMMAATYTSQQCNLVLGVSGQLMGCVIYGMSLSTADQIASTMMGQQIKTFDQLAASAIEELGGILGCHSHKELARRGYACEVSSPAIVRGSNVKVSSLTMPAVVVPMLLPHGEVFVSVGLQERKLAAKAKQPFAGSENADGFGALREQSQRGIVLERHQFDERSTFERAR